jgi:hypothetical protein
MVKIEINFYTANPTDRDGIVKTTIAMKKKP